MFLSLHVNTYYCYHYVHACAYVRMYVLFKVLVHYLLLYDCSVNL